MGGTHHTFALIVGGGMSGITLAVQILKQNSLTRDEFKIFDNQERYGGVWEANKYPGAACDVPSHAYQMPFHLNPNWSRKYAPRAEIQQYCAQMANYYKLEQCTIFNMKVISATWNIDTLMYDVLVENTKSGMKEEWSANMVVDAGGQFYRPKWAKIPGAEEFIGDQWHTAQWRDDIDLTGKRVAIIGTGPSTGQVAPMIAHKVKELTLYQRSATYVMPRKDMIQPGWRKTLFRWFPLALWFYNVSLWWNGEMSKKMWLADTAENLQAKERALAFLEKQVEDPDTRKKLTPTTNFGCKRLLVLDDWYPIFNLPNVHLITDKPIRITEDGIISKPPTQLPISELKDQPTGAYSTNNVTEDAKELDTKIDVLIWGTGFDMAGQGSHFQVYGLNGILLEKQFGDRPQAFYSVAVANFPNFLMMLGPNSANFWSTLPVVIQIQAKYNAKVIKRIKQKSQKKAYAMSVTMEAQNEFNKWINENMDGIALASPGCSNYYTNSKGEVTYHSPMHSWTYAWRLKWPNMNNYTIISPHSTPSGVNGAS